MFKPANHPREVSVPRGTSTFVKSILVKSTFHVEHGPHFDYTRTMSNEIEIIARGLLLHNDSVLLCQNRKHGYLFLPGGHIDFNEPAKVALAREIQEELGIEVEIGEFLGTCESAFDQLRKDGTFRRHHEINLVFAIHPTYSTASLDSIQSQEDHIQFIWQPLASLKDKTCTPLPTRISDLILASANSSTRNRWISSFV